MTKTPREPIHPDLVKEAWERSGGASTIGILNAFLARGIVDQWYREPLTEEVLGDLRLIGGPSTSPWARLSGATFLVSKCSSETAQIDLTTDPSPLEFVCIEDGEQVDRRVLLDGCHRAVALWHRKQIGHPIPPGVTLYTGVLSGLFRFTAAAASSFWR